MKLRYWTGVVLLLSVTVPVIRHRWFYPLPMPNRPLNAVEQSLASAEKVEVRRLELERFGGMPPGTLDKYKTARLVTWTKGSALANAKAVVIRAAKEEGSSPSCIPEAGVGLRFISGPEHHDIVICFKCMQWTWEANGVHWRGMGPNASRMLNIARQAFPDDGPLKAQRAFAKRVSRY